VAPNDLRYTKTHEWVRLETSPIGAKIATVGITAFALEALTDLVYLGLPEVGRQLKVGELLGEVESVKAVSDLYSPVDGEVLEVNSAVAENLEQLSRDPYGAGWLVKAAVRPQEDLAHLMDEAAYRKQCAQELADH
jgi:glycine cleavage system H protein